MYHFIQCYKMEIFIWNFLITSYLPAGNSADEIMRYSETLDEVYELTQK